MASDNLMTFITGVKYSKNLLQTLNGITFLFDPNWQADKQTDPTFPVCFFHVKSVHEVMEAKVSEKPMMFFNGQAGYDPRSANASVMNMVADNIIINPKTYKLDIIIPYNDLSLITSNPYMSEYQERGVMDTVTGNTDINLALRKGMLVTKVYSDILLTFLRRAGTLADYSSITSYFNSAISTPDYNKNSLEAMFRNRGILKLKLWNSWKYKYVALTNFDISKEPTEDGVYEASITCQEMPIITVRGDAGLKIKSFTNPILSATGNTIKAIINGKEVQ